MGPAVGLWSACLGVAGSPAPTLAQSGFGIIDPPAPPPLTNPPLVEHYLLENPWPLIVILVVVGAITGFRLRAIGQTRLACLAATAILLAGVAEYVLSWTVQTRREEIVKATEALVGAAARADTTALSGMLSEELSVFRPGGGPALGKAETLEKVQRELGGFSKIHDWAVLDAQAKVDSPTSGVTQVRLRITLEAIGFPNISWWKIDWRKGGDGLWRAVTIEPISVTPEVKSQMR